MMTYKEGNEMLCEGDLCAKPAVVRASYGTEGWCDYCIRCVPRSEQMRYMDLEAVQAEGIRWAAERLRHPSMRLRGKGQTIPVEQVLDLLEKFASRLEAPGRVKRVPPTQIEGIVGVDRFATAHCGRAVTLEERVYVLHSVECVNSHTEETCEFSEALARGIRLKDWESAMDRPVELAIRAGRLVPA